MSVAIPTFRRPELLAKAIRSVRCQKGIDPTSFEILVVDNAPEGSARSVCEAVGPALPPLRYIHESGRGPSHARNCAVRHAQGDIIAFLDDDEEAAPDWLSSLLKVMDETNADAAFGSVHPRLAQAPAHIAQFADKIFRRDLQMQSGTTVGGQHASLGTGNSAFRITRCFDGESPFSLKLSAFGGEDVDILRRLVKSGRVLAWAPEARVDEIVPSDRLTPEALWHRRFRQGQLRAALCVQGAQKDCLGLLFWMGAGFVQAGGCLLLAAVRMLRGDAPGRQLAMLEAAGGLGKLLWWRRARARYGQE